jgi:hypothetical protein
MFGRLALAFSLALIGACGSSSGGGTVPPPGDTGSSPQDSADSAIDVDSSTPETPSTDTGTPAPDSSSSDTATDAVDAPVDAPVYAEFGKTCTTDGDCGKGTCQPFGTGVVLCTLPCKVAADCPVGSEGQKCNLKGFCRP